MKNVYVFSWFFQAEKVFTTKKKANEYVLTHIWEDEETDGTQEEFLKNVWDGNFDFRLCECPLV